MKRRCMVICSICILAVVLLAGWFLCKPIFYRLYPFDRITGTLTVTVDGEIYIPESSDFDGLTNFQLREDGTSKLRIHAGEYGGYPILLHLDADAVKEIEIRCFQGNWWDVAKFDLQVNVQTDAQTVTVTGEYSTVGEDYRRSADRIDNTKPIENQTVRFSFGL